MSSHLLSQLTAEDMLEARVVVNPFCVEELPPGNSTLEQNGTQHSPARVERGAKAGRPATHDNDIELAADHTFPGLSSRNIERLSVPARSAMAR
jgi:hypothetical protein